MECRSCRRGVGDRDKFCSQCGARLLPAGPAADPENDLPGVAPAPAPQGGLEPGEALRVDENQNLPRSSGDWQENPEEPSADASWTVVQSKKRRRKNKCSTSSEPDSFPSAPSSLSSVSVAADPGSQAPGLSQSHVRQDGPRGQPADAGPEGAGPAQPAEQGSRPLQAQAGGEPAGTVGEKAPSSPVPHHAERGDREPSMTSADTGLPQEGLGAASAAGQGCPKATGASASGLPGATAEPAHPASEARREREDKAPNTEQLPDGAPAAKEVGQEAETKGKLAVPGEMGESRSGKPEEGKKAEGKRPEEGKKAEEKKQEEGKKAEEKKQEEGKKAEGKRPEEGKKAEEKKQEEGKKAEGKKQEEGKKAEERKLEENNRNYAAAVKNEKEQRNQTTAVQKALASTLSPGEGVMVYFHAILSNHFAFKPDVHKVFVRGGEKLGKPAWKNACELHYTKDLGANGSLVEGSLVIPRESLGTPIPYKYVIDRGDQASGEYEYIYKPVKKKGHHVNRCLCVQPALLGTGDWHQYDDIVCMHPSIVKKAMNLVINQSQKEVVRGKQIAAEIMLGRVLSILQPWSAVNLDSFFTQSQQFFSVVRVPMVYEESAQPWSSLQYDEMEVKGHLWQCLERQMKPFLDERTKDSLPQDCPVRTRLRMGLIVLFQVQAMDLTLTKSDLASLCQLLVPTASSPAALHSELQLFLHTSMSQSYIEKNPSKGEKQPYKASCVPGAAPCAEAAVGAGRQAAAALERAQPRPGRGKLSGNSTLVCACASPESGPRTSALSSVFGDDSSQSRSRGHSEGAGRPEDGERAQAVGTSSLGLTASSAPTEGPPFPCRWQHWLQKLCNRCLREKVVSGLGILPVLHYVMQLTPPQRDSLNQPEDWAALKGIRFPQLPEEAEHQNHMLQFMVNHKHLLQVDAYLFRSWFSLLPLGKLASYMENSVEYLSQGPAQVFDCFVGVHYQLRRPGVITQQNVEDVKAVLNMLLYLLDMYQHSALGPSYSQSYLTVGLELHLTICGRTMLPDLYEAPALSAQLLSVMARLVDQAEGAEAEATKGLVAPVLQDVLKATQVWLHQTFRHRMFQTCGSRVQFTYPKEIEVWRRLVTINFPVELGWKESLLRDMEGRLKQERPRAQISIFCDTRWDDAHGEDSVARSFEKCVVEAVSAACQSHTSVLQDLSCHDLRRFGVLASAVITKSWPKTDGKPTEDPHEVLKHLLTWPDVKRLFDLYGTNEKILAHTTEEGRRLMNAAESVFRAVVRGLQDGTVVVQQLELVLKHKQEFLHLCDLKREDPSFQESPWGTREVLHWRRAELRALEREERCVGSLLQLCERLRSFLHVDFGELEARHREDLSRKRLNEVVSVTPPSRSFSKPKTHYNLQPEIQEMASRMDLLKDSHVFHVLWESMVEPLNGLDQEPEKPVIPLSSLHEHLFSPCYERFTKLYRDLKSADITFQEIADTFKDFVGKYEELTADLRVMCMLEPEAPEDWIPERVSQIKEYHSLHQAASTARVICQVQRNLGLTGDFSVLSTLLSFSEDFETYRRKKLAQISRQLIHTKKLLADIGAARRRCLEELSLQTELVAWLREALGDINGLKVFVDLASISAGENDIDVDRVACFHDAVQGYASLLYKLHPEAGFPEFRELLQELWEALDKDPHLPHKLRDSARNLEWLKTVKESHGSVELSSLSLATAINSRGIYVIEAPKGDQKVCMDAALHLLLPESHGATDAARDYSLEELKELLNKLMLMSGKKDNKHVEMETFSEVFCSVQRLCQAFINLYSAGNMLFRTWTVEIYCSPRQGTSIRMDFGLEQVGQLSESGDVIECLEALCRQMEHFLDRWMMEVTQKRAEHFYLNFYTAEQLVYLSTELRKGNPSTEALTMLSFIKDSCTASDVLQATEASISTAARDLEAKVRMSLHLLLSCTSCLVPRLRIIMDKSLVCISAFLPGCLDLEALGHCLAQLARQAGPPVHRSLPRGLCVGQPNLVLCGYSEVLPAALALYMHDPRQPLPTFDEVLVCTPQTEFEEVALLLRRCLTPGSGGRKVYSLLFADQLSYEVGCRAEALFQSLCSRPHRHEYQLVMVCDSTREHCYLPSAFSRHKVLLIPQAPLKDIQAYLKHHFQVPEQTPSAAAAFKDGLCVGLVTSERAGVGKSLYVQRLHGKLRKQLKHQNVPLKTIRLTEPRVDENYVLGSLLPFLDKRYQQIPVIFHLDVTSSVQTGIWVFLFKLLILQYLMDVRGKMWLRNPRHLYLVEISERSSERPVQPSKLNSRLPPFRFLDVFPKVTCRPPKEVINLELTPGERLGEPGMDPTAFRSEAFQRPFQYLKRFHRKENLDSFEYRKGSVEGTPGECLQHLLIYCGVVNPSWSELQNFTRFLNCQLGDCENSLFCKLDFVGDTLRGFKNFVVTFMICMARDFATPTLHTSDQSPGSHLVTMDGVTEEDLAPFSLRKRWESEPHPYVFFNGDRMTMTFIGFHLQPKKNGFVDAINHRSGQVIKSNVMTTELYQGLLLQRVPFNVDFDRLPRHEKLERLCLALGIPWATDPDETYELTTDNMLKILAIEMRFRCGIPVIVMGETGCGKTRLIRFLSDLRRGGVPADTLQLVKVHGGTTAATVYSRVQEAQELAIENRDRHQLDTILFFDEANTTEAISCIKEVLCDQTVGGDPLERDSGLQIIAACNPYRKHSEEAISRLESAGLGYRVRAEETAERLGSIPLRQLVYRVHALPPSLIPLVWDFGQLNAAAEKLYIRQIVQRLVGRVEVDEPHAHVIARVLAASQAFMRKRENECGFVSLRDVERCVKVFRWFHHHSAMLLAELNAFLCQSEVSGDDFDRNPVLWSLVMAIGVCYHASLEDKASYRRAVCPCFPEPYNDSTVILEEITRTQDLFLNGVPLRKTIAKNLALKENVFMMIVCIELRIPLFLVGKPGSSKSLAKTIVADAMQGQAAHSSLFRRLKQVHLVSFQCSPHSTPQGIIGTFRQCARFQQGKDLQRYVSVVVLDEVGLAEDSPRMPLKTLHPLLEDGCIEDDPSPHKKVGFIGISNWALDPAKMNRGIFVSRGRPNEQELLESARGICSSDAMVQRRVEVYFVPFARAYEAVCRRQDKEFFGLRDYYSLIKMVFAWARASDRKPAPQGIAHAVLRNFSGKDDIPALDIFMASLPEARYADRVSTLELIRQNVYGAPGSAPGEGPEEAECRYLLVLTKNYAALPVLQQMLAGEARPPEIIFGSSFPQDQEYTQICRNINRVKICMETGRTVVLLNLQNLYESLYDALNQYYVYLGGQKYVDLGLGTHRVKCRVHADFRLVVIEEKDVVYTQFPVPLINRLEKHYLDVQTVLEGWQKDVVRELAAWARDFAEVRSQQFTARHGYRAEDVFVGYHSDACGSVVLQATERQRPGDLAAEELHDRVLEAAKLVLLDCATPDAVVRLGACALDAHTAQRLAASYYHAQQHDSFADFLQAHLRTARPGPRAALTEVTTFSRLLTSHDCEALAAELQGLASRPTLLCLQQFDTESSFLREVRNCLTSPAGNKILIIQIDFDDSTQGARLLASAKYSAINEINKIEETGDRIFVYFITKLSRMGSGLPYVGFHGGPWRSVHIDDLRRCTLMASDVTKLQSVTISQLFRPGDGPVPKPREEGDQENGVDMDSAASGAVCGTEPESGGPEAMEWAASGPGEAEVLDTTRLLRGCVPGAVGMLRDRDERGSRNMRRVAILLGLLDGEPGADAAFLRVCKMRLHVLLHKQEENLPPGLKAWVSREAANQDALQEAGTFRHTLWKRVQGAVTPLLASMIAITDRDGNLELLTRPALPAWVPELWMFIFSDVNFLNIPLVVNNTAHQGEVPPIVVQSDMGLPEHASNSVPFSWRIKDYVEELWIQAQYISDADGSSRKLVEIFQKTPLGRFLTRLPAEQQEELMEDYAKDFLLLTRRVSSRQELRLLQMALLSCTNDLRAAGELPEAPPSLPWVHLAHRRFRPRLQTLACILSICPRLPQSLARYDENFRHVATHRLILDASAAMGCVRELEELLRPSPEAWLRLVKSLSVPLELACSDAYVRDCWAQAAAILRDARTSWNRIYSVALFVEHVLLETERQLPELGPLVRESVLILDRCLQDNSDMKTYEPFAAVTNMLRDCKDTCLARFGLQPCVFCLGDPRDPVCLPCGHVYCLPCIRSWLVPGQLQCPDCLTDLPDDFSLTVSQEHRIAIEKHARFRHLCNCFFVDLVSTMCFKDGAPPEKKVVDSLLSLLFAQKQLPREAPQRQREHTKCLSPFNDVVDRTPVIRSVVLKLLLKYSFREVRDYIQNYLSQLEKKAFLAEDKTELYLLFISCLEDSMHEKTSALSKSNELSHLREEGHFLSTYFPGGGDPEAAPPASVGYLQEVARIRLCLDKASDFLSEHQEGGELAEGKRRFLRQVERFCTRTGNDWHRVYLLRRLCSQRGLGFLQGLTRRGHPLRWVLPPPVLAEQDTQGQMDAFLVHGEEYKALRDAVGKAMLECKTVDVGRTLKASRSPRTRQAALLLLALYREVAALHRSPKPSLRPSPEQCEAMSRFITESKLLASQEVRRFATSLVDSTLPLLRTGPGDSGLEGTVIEMAIHTASVLLCGQNKALEPLKNLAFSPDKMVDAFLPTMPEDLLAQAQHWMALQQVKWYTCPNGHPCSVGECGQPMEQSKCPDCGALVGGIDHRPNPGFEVIGDHVADRTQTGHVLGAPQPASVAVASDRPLSPVVFLLLRLLTHLTMFWGAAQSPQAVFRIIKPPVRDPQGFLQQHILRDLERLAKTLGKGADETTHAVHALLGSLLGEPRPASRLRPLDFDATWSTKGQRNNWEKYIEALLLPELNHLDKTLLDVRDIISQDERISSDPVAKIIYGDPATFLPHLPRKSVVHCSKIWRCRKKITVEYLQHIVEQKNGQEAVPLLWHFLQKEAELRLVKFLPEILALQRDLVKQFQNIPEVEFCSIRGFISSHSSDGLQQLFHRRVAVFLSTWNALRRSLETHGEIKLPTDYCRADLDLDSEFEVILPRPRGPGLCSTALVRYLIRLHNEIIYSAEKFSKENNSYCVDASEVADLHVITYDVERDLMPVILANCQYQVQQGGETLQDFDLEKIQRQIRSRLLQGKPRLTLRGIPTLVYRHDWNYEHLFMDIKHKMEQHPLPSSATSAIGGQLQSYSDACEALSVVEVTLGFLSTAGGDPTMQLDKYVQDVLRMGDQMSPVLKALSRCQLRHAVALWQFLSAYKSEQLLRLKREPFRDFSQQYKADLSPEHARLLRAFLNLPGLDAFLLELHEMMVLKLRGAQSHSSFNPDWSLRDTLVSYMETKESEGLPEVASQFPEEITMSNCISVWKAAAARKQERQGR
ncbi:E3 ubiquitin-protein ligase RNF213 [Perognathus longimembris pacificus]|uniref:E3 ubiquitin-protein ligase RNF213 n=1 Tax=Perognathus longimembris pacificus TaxID=214514 RepID=UPI00201A0CB4|nr:E3 ubiquitin-protein ligase RNF213 [Perognathus longimembris pacificus]